MFLKDTEFQLREKVIHIYSLSFPSLLYLANSFAQSASPFKALGCLYLSITGRNGYPKKHFSVPSVVIDFQMGTWYPAKDKISLHLGLILSSDIVRTKVHPTIPWEPTQQARQLQVTYLFCLGSEDSVRPSQTCLGSELLYTGPFSATNI